MPAYKPDQRQQVSSAGELPNPGRKRMSPDGAQSGMLKRIELIDGSFVAGLNGSTTKVGRRNEVGKLPKTL